MMARSDPEMRAAQVDMADALFPDGVQAFELRPALDRLTAPTAIIWGRSDHIVPWRHALAARGEMALHLLPEVGHIPHVECPGTVAGILARNMTQTDRR
jgi:pimeloyl-ACP methyl ester carboxylesterase